MESNDINKDVFPHTYSKICGRCGQNKSLDLFYPSTSSADGKQSYCKVCSKANDTESRTKKRIERQLALRKYQTKAQFNSKGYFEALNGGQGLVGRPDKQLSELTPARLEFLEIQREYWKKVFAERHDDIMKLIKAYEAEPDNSVQLIADFHENVRPTWKLEHKTPKQTRDEYYEFLKNKSGSTDIS